MMSTSAPPEVEQKITALCDKLWNELNKCQAATFSDLLAVWQDAHNIYQKAAAANLEKQAERYGVGRQSDIVDKIEADAITVEILDKNTGLIYRRCLPVNYCETSNGLVLTGETIEGAPAQIAFLSETALDKMMELFGQGADTPRCGGTGDHSDV